jgi:L-rhamnonate dehydratase
MMAPKADEVVPMFHPQLIGEPVPENGKLKLSDAPGFGVELNREVGCTVLTPADSSESLDP